MKFIKLGFLIFVNLFVLLIFVTLVELGSLVTYNKLYKSQDDLSIIPWPQFVNHYYHRKMRTHRENLILEHSKTQKGKFNSTYTTTITGKRLTPEVHKRTERDILFYGCSFTYGEGVNDNQTVPYYTQELLENTRAHNLGLSGYGPNEALDAVLNMDQLFSDDPALENPIGIYIYFNDHISRATFNLSHMYWTDILSLRTFRLKKNGDIDKALFYKEMHPIKYFLYALLQTSRLSRILYLELMESSTRAPVYEKENILKTFEILKATQDKFIERYPDGKFYIFTLDNEDESQLSLMKDYGLNVLNNTKDGFDSSRLPDGHFDAYGNKQMAKRLIELLKVSKAL